MCVFVHVISRGRRSEFLLLWDRAVLKMYEGQIEFGLSLTTAALPDKILDQNILMIVLILSTYQLSNLCIPQVPLGFNAVQITLLILRGKTVALVTTGCSSCLSFHCYFPFPGPHACLQTSPLKVHWLIHRGFQHPKRWWWQHFGTGSS